MTAPSRINQLSRVIEALQQGCDTIHLVESYTGLPRQHCSKYLVRLRRDGVAVITHRNALRVHKTGPAMHRYALAGTRTTE